MTSLNLKPTQKIIATYYDDLAKLAAQAGGNALKEGAVAPMFAALLRHCAAQFNRTLIEQYTAQKGSKTLFFDGAIADQFNLVYGVWEAKDDADDLPSEVKKKFAAGYPKDNILFQAPQRAILWQNGQYVNDWNLARPDALIAALRAFFEYTPPVYDEWRQAVEQFSGQVKEIGAGLVKLIEGERQSKNADFLAAFDNFVTICRDNINPNISIPAVEEMLIQHILTERIFTKMFNNPDFVNLNIIAHEIEKVVFALVKPHGGRAIYFKPLDRFYHAIEATAAALRDFTEKQRFLNTVYERFFQGFSVKVADTHGIVYTPQPVVQFMVNSVEEVLKSEFGLTDGLSAPNVHILDPFVGTGNFLAQVMRKLNTPALSAKYARELHCNEVMLLPYYIAAMNIEHEYYTRTGGYAAFPGICFVDTFQLADPEQKQFDFMTPENTKRVKTQKAAPIFVILGNPPYNAGQVNENDNNKNRKYPVLDKHVRESYAKSSGATNKNALADVYVKAIKWASDRIAANGEGIVAFVTNNSFLDGVAFDGMRKQLAEEFDAIYVLDLGGNVRKNPKLSGTTHNVFGIQVGVSINLFVKKKNAGKVGKIWYARCPEDWRKEQKYHFLEQAKQYKNIDWQAIAPDAKHNWLTEGMQDEFDTFLPMGTKEGKAAQDGDIQAIFKTYSGGVKTNRDVWAYNFQERALTENMQRMIETYNFHVFKYSKLSPKPDIDAFVENDDKKISWSRDLKLDVRREHFAEFQPEKIRRSLYRPFTQEYLFFDSILNEEVYQFPHIFPTPEAEAENRVICVSGVGSNKPFHCLMTHQISCLDMLEKTQCFPFYTYDENGARRENITDWALAQFRARYGSVETHGRASLPDRAPLPLNKWDIFYYIYALLHHPAYRAKYAANLKRGLPRIPFAAPKLSDTSQVSDSLAADSFWAFADAGRKLAELHVNYEAQPEFPLRFEETAGVNFTWRVEKMKLTTPPAPSPNLGEGDQGGEVSLMYNDAITLRGIPPEALEYRLGNKSALHWLVDQYQVSTDPRSGIRNDPNRADAPEYIVKLIKKIVTVSVETVKILRALPECQPEMPETA